MQSVDPGIRSESVCFPFTPSQTARELLFYPTWCGHYYCTANYFMKRDSYPPLLIAYNNTLPLWTLKGHTPAELMDPEQAREAQAYHARLQPLARRQLVAPAELDRALAAARSAQAQVRLAAAVLERQAHALNPRGEMYSAANIAERLSMRNFLEELRGSGVQTGGPAAFSAGDRQAFGAALDRFLARRSG